MAQCIGIGSAQGRVGDMAFKPSVPRRFGELRAGYGLMFSCAGCRRGVTYAYDELIRRFGEEGRVADVVTRFRCSNCRDKRPGRPPPAVRVDVMPTKVFIGRTEGERARDKLGPIDKLMWDIERLKPPPID